MTPWCRATIRDSDDSARGRSLLLEGPGVPDLTAVDEVAHWMLDAKRVGGYLAIEYLAPELADLLDLAGLLVEVQGKTERGE